MKYLLASAAILCMLLTAGCGHEPLYENSAEISATEETEDPTENIETSDGVTDAAENADVSYIPENAAYKCTEYLVNNGESEIDEIKYCDEFGNTVRIISYLDDKILQITDAENEYNSDGQVIRTKQSAKSFVEYLYNGDSVVELEYNENGFVKKETIHQDESVTIIEFEYEYDEQGRPAAVTEYFNGRDEVFSKTYKTYDENGNVTKEKIGLMIGKQLETFYEYDENGRVLKAESKFVKSPVYSEYEYEDYKDFTIKRPNGLTY